VIGQLIGTSERTVKRVDQVATVAPEAVDKVAAGTISAAQVLRLRTQNKPSRPRTSAPPSRAAAPSAADPMMSHSTPAAPSSSPPSTGRTLTEMRAELPTAMRQILDELEERVRTLLQLLEGMGAADSHRRCIAELLEHLADRVRNGAGPIRP
jgi:hypothetical protein